MRAEKVYAKVKELTEKLTEEDLFHRPLTLHANYISALLNYDRSNVSRDLNMLVNQGKLVKVKGRPVSFLEKQALERHLKFTIPPELKVVDRVSDLLEEKDDGFAELIGASGSLKSAVEQAKASVLYPPKGLNMMLTGGTGVGKTTFSSHIYQFARLSGHIKNGGKLVVFNCSEYASNPQLLLGQLFGHVKGAFTGAEVEKAGLVDEADGGILLLDEIHRLLPEGQEMLFLLLDRGVYRRLGETGIERSAELMIIGATTEDLDSALLKTFLRRFQMLIIIPSLNERPLEERFSLLAYFFHHESQKIGAHLFIDQEVIYTLMAYPCQGNIGQLKGDIQLICARGLLDLLSNQNKDLYIDQAKLPKHMLKDSGKTESGRRQRIYRVMGKQKVYHIDPSDSPRFIFHQPEEHQEEKEFHQNKIEIIVIDEQEQSRLTTYLREKMKEKPECKEFLFLSKTQIKKFPLRELQKEYGCKIVLIEEFTSGMLEDAYAKVNKPNVLLEHLAHQLIRRQMDRYGEQQNLLQEAEQDSGERKLILTTCITGKGSALKIAQLIEEHMEDLAEKNICLLPTNVDRQGRTDIQGEVMENVIAVVGTVDLELEGVPYVSLDQLVLSDGVERLRKIIDGEGYHQFTAEEMRKIISLLENNTQFLDAKKLIAATLTAFEELHVEIGMDRLKSLRVRYLLHCACMVERVIQGNFLQYVNIGETLRTNAEEASLIRKVMTLVEHSFSIRIPDDEIGFLLDLLYRE